MSNKCKETINDVEDIFIKENKGTIRIPRLFDLKIALLLTLNSRNHNIKFLNAVIFALFGFKFLLSVLSVHIYMVEVLYMCSKMDLPIFLSSRNCVV